MEVYEGRDKSVSCLATSQRHNAVGVSHAQEIPLLTQLNDALHWHYNK